jgi:hypothetical protein
MILDTIRLVTDVLASPGADGLAQAIAAVARDGSDPLPATPTVLDETRSLAVALGRVPEAQLPALTVALDDVIDLDPRAAQLRRDAEVALHLRYVVRASGAAVGTRDWYYVCDAIVRCLDAMLRTSARTRNKTTVFSVTDCRILPPMDPLEDQWVIGGLRVVLQVRSAS